MRRWLQIVLAIVALFIVIVAYKWWRAGEFNSLTPVPLECRRISGLVGPEDITVNAQRGVAYISATNWRAVQNDQPTTGGLYIYRQDAAPKRLADGLGPTFRPHGISLWSDGAGPDLLYVVNHRAADSHTIEVFEIIDDGLHHIETLKDAHLVSPNDVVAVGRGELYVTNDHGVPPGPGQMVDDLVGRRRAQIVHVKSGRFRLLVDDLAFANGINASADGKVIVVAEATGRRIRTYRRSPNTGDLMLEATKDLGTGPDNIERGPDGTWYIGAHPKLFTFLRHASNPATPSPSQVVQLRNGEAKTIYLDLGTELSASTVAAPLGNHLLIGAVFADYFLDCTAP